MTRQILTPFDTPNFMILASSNPNINLNVLALEKEAKIDPKTVQIDDYTFTVGSRWTQIGTGEYTSSGFVTAICLEGFEHEYKGMIDDWLCFSLLKDGQEVPIIEKKKQTNLGLFQEEEEYRYFFGMMLRGNTAYIYNYVAIARIIPLKKNQKKRKKQCFL